METPYVVKLHRHYLLAEAQPVFTFEHPNREEPIDNGRYLQLVFHRSADSPGATIHGAL